MCATLIPAGPAPTKFHIRLKYSFLDTLWEEIPMIATLIGASTRDSDFNEYPARNPSKTIKMAAKRKALQLRCCLLCGSYPS